MFECCCLFQNNKQGTHDIEQNVYEKKMRFVSIYNLW